ncbi:uncharacterized protein LOC129230450 [Uloborus diversus]|uniref:uncharacterized protein LOC129230450 n=1 Tax=Uloborus diversus TaxID=327109 RepID=UPI00240A5D57|nr:uncharacterized protein LOC129230450 [Uloborus diversus]
MGQCMKKIFSEKISNANEKGLQHHSEVQNFGGITLKKILRNAIGGNAKTTMIMHFNISSPTLENDLNTANCILKIADSHNRPKICQKLILRNSLDKYEEEIRELHRNINATENKVGLLVCGKYYSWLKNSLLCDTETLKSLEPRSNLTDILNCKKHILAQINSSKSAVQEQIKEEEKTEEITAELEKLRNSNHSLNEKISSVANKVLSLKNVSSASKTSTNHLIMELSKMRDINARVIENIQMLNKDLKIFYETAEAEFSSLQIDLESVLVCFKNNLEAVNVEQSESLSKLNDLNLNCDSASNTWKFCMDSLLSNLHAFIDNHNQNCFILRGKILTELETLNKTQQEITDIINKNRNVKIQLVTSFSHKIQISTKASTEILSEISILLNETQMKIKKELKAVEVRVCCAGKEFSTCINDLSSSLRKSELYFPQQENSSAKINTHVSNQQLNFRKNIDAEIQKIKNSLQCIREMYSLHNACAVDLWNQRQGDFFEMERNTEDLFKSLTQFQEDLPKMYNDAFPSDYDYYYNSLKDSKENVGFQLG